MSIYDVVHNIAQGMGVPDRLWQSVVQIESGGDPNQVGDAGTSFGLFQLHVGGQAPAGVPTSQLLDPATNARYGLPAIRNAWQSLGPSFNDSVAWWSQFAAQSGHPGYDPVLDPKVAEKLKAAYDANNFSFGTPGTPLTSGPGSTKPTTPGAPSLNPLQGMNDFFGTIGNVFSKTNWGDFGIRAGLVTGGIILVIIALVIVFGPAVSNAANSPEAKDAMMMAGA